MLKRLHRILCLQQKNSAWRICTVGNPNFPNPGSKSQTGAAIVSNHWRSLGHICLCKQGFSCRRADITKKTETKELLAVQVLVDLACFAPFNLYYPVLQKKYGGYWIGNFVVHFDVIVKFSIFLIF